MECLNLNSSNVNSSSLLVFYRANMTFIRHQTCDYSPPRLEMNFEIPPNEHSECKTYSFKYKHIIKSIHRLAGICFLFQFWKTEFIPLLIHITAKHIFVYSDYDETEIVIRKHYYITNCGVCGPENRFDCCLSIYIVLFLSCSVSTSSSHFSINVNWGCFLADGNDNTEIKTFSALDYRIQMLGDWIQTKAFRAL